MRRRAKLNGRKSRKFVQIEENISRKHHQQLLLLLLLYEQLELFPKVMAQAPAADQVGQEIPVQ